MRARRPDTRRQNQSSVVRPASSAAKCATCVGGIGQSVPLRRPPSSPSGRDKQPQNDRAQDQQEEAHLTAQHEQVAPNPPGSEEPQHEEKPDEAEAAIGGSEADKANAHHERGNGEQGEKSKEPIGSDAHSWIDRQYQHERDEQCTLRDELSDFVGDRYNRASGGVEHVEEEQGPDDPDPAWG